MYILGVSCWYHDAAACLVRDGHIIAAAQEERFSRIKHDAGFPEAAIAYCLRHADIKESDIDFVAFYDKPLLKFERILETFVAHAPKGLPAFYKAIPIWLKQKLWIPDRLDERLGSTPVIYPEHHESHAASAFFPSPFQKAAIVTVDGVGEWATTSIGMGAGNQIQILYEQHFPHSLGLLYSAFTYFCGFKVNSGEYKLMGLAPFGEPTYRDVILDKLIDLREDGSFRINTEYFDYPAGLRMTGRKFEKLFGGPARKSEQPLTRREMDLARSIQVVTEKAILAIVDHACSLTGMDDVCLAGGVALNCVANGKIVAGTRAGNVWIQPAAGDAGGAVGAALVAWHHYVGSDRAVQLPDGMRGALLGPNYTDVEIETAIVAAGLPWTNQPDDDLLRLVADRLAAGKVVGWFQDRMEFGPRALGNRSILADARDPDAQQKVNLKIKFRESFRPFAPSVVNEAARDYFDLQGPSPYMLMVAEVLGASSSGEGFDRLRGIRSPIPAVTHVDGSARIQTVSSEVNPLFYRLLKSFEQVTGCPVLVNTSFNVRGEPIVCSPDDAIRCFLRTNMDILVMGRYLIDKESIPNHESFLMSSEEIAQEYGLD